MHLLKLLSGGALLAALPLLCSSTFLPTYVDTSEGSKVTEFSYDTFEEGVGHFSEWSKSTKRDFIDDVRAGKAQDWVIVMGNEGGGEQSKNIYIPHLD